MTSRTRPSRAFPSLAGICLIVLAPVAATAQAGGVGEMIEEINLLLAQHPAGESTVTLALEEGERLVARTGDDRGTLLTAEIHLEDIEFVTVQYGRIRLECREDLGRCVKETCRGDFLNFSGCARGSGSVRRLTSELGIAYEYDPRVNRSLGSTFERLLKTISTD